MKVDIDLTDDADDLGGPSSKRQRTVWYGGDVVIVEQHPAGGATVQAEAADTDVDVLLVERDGEAAAQLQQDEEAAGLPGDDEDVRLVGQSGEVQLWNSDLTHLREHCGKHPFVSKMVAGNAQHCPKCYCFVCDCLASECSQWAAGPHKLRHCHAHSRDKRYATMRKYRQQKRAHDDKENEAVNLGQAEQAGPGPAAAAAAASTAALAAASEEPVPMDEAAAAAAGSSAAAEAGAAAAKQEPAEWPAFAAAEAQAQAGSAAVPAVPAIAAALVELPLQTPAAAQAAGLALLAPGESRPATSWAESKFAQAGPSNAAAGIAADLPAAGDGVRAGLVAGGVMEGHEGAVEQQQQRVQQSPARWGNLVEMPDPRTDPQLLQLAEFDLECKAAGGNTIAGLAARLVPNGFHVTRKMDFGDRQAPMRYGVTVDKRATIEEVMAAAAPLAGLTEEEEFLPLNVASTAEDAPLKVIPPGTRVSDTAIGTDLLKVLLWRLPKLDPASGVRCVIYHKSRTYNEDAAAERAVLESLLLALESQRCANVGPSVAGPALQPVQVDQFLASGAKLYWAKAHMLSDTLANPGPCFLFNQGAQPVPSTSEGGGRGWSSDLEESDAHNSSMQAASLSAAGALTAGGSAGAAVRAGGAGGAAGRVGPAEQGAGASNGVAALGAGTRLGRAASPAAADARDANGMLCLRLDWPETELDKFSMQLPVHPHIHETARPAALQGTEQYISRLLAWRKKRKEITYDAMGVVRELIRAGRLSPDDASSEAAVIRVCAKLQPDAAPDGDPTVGRLHVSVFVCRSENTSAAASALRAFFQRSEEVIPGDVCLPIPKIMKRTLQMNQAMRAVQEALNDFRYARYDIKGFLEAMERGPMPAAPQPQGLTVAMRPHQLQSLQFMLSQERSDGGFRDFVWVEMTGPRGEKWWYSPLTKCASLAVPPMVRGGFLCEEMGLGKTVEVLGLVLSNPAPPLPAGENLKDANGLIKSRATLVVCPVTLVGQWEAEVKSKAGESLRTYVYYGQTRLKDPVKLSQYDLVITSYNTLAADFQLKAEKKENGKGKQKQPLPLVNCPGDNLFPPLGTIKWHRVVLDESHVVKDLQTVQTRACAGLQAEHRWLATGTPINSSMYDLLGQLVVLGLLPFGKPAYFKEALRYSEPTTMSNAGLMYVLDKCMVRHSKKQVLDGQAVLQLPPLFKEDVPVLLTAEEQAMYRQAHAKAKAGYTYYAGGGALSLCRNFLAIMALLQPMRRICSGGKLQPKDLEIKDPLSDDDEPGGEGRPVAPAGKVFCRVPPTLTVISSSYLSLLLVSSLQDQLAGECITGALENNPRCPLCRTELHEILLRAGRAAPAAAAGEGVVAGVADSKLQALLQELRAMRLADPTAKALVFSQFSSTIEWLKVRLTQEGWGFRFISGGMPAGQRAKAIRAFQEDPPTTVFLLSMRSGSVGINLTAASHVFILDPALNPALEAQAIGRSWRMGQQRSVVVKRLFVKGSVEEAVIEVAQQRQEANGGANTEDDDMHVKYKIQSVAGSISMDRQELRASELETLFRDPDFPPPRVPDPPPARGMLGPPGANAGPAGAAATANPFGHALLPAGDVAPAVRHAHVSGHRRPMGGRVAALRRPDQQAVQQQQQQQQQQRQQAQTPQELGLHTAVEALHHAGEAARPKPAGALPKIRRQQLYEVEVEVRRSGRLRGNQPASYAEDQMFQKIGIDRVDLLDLPRRRRVNVDPARLAALREERAREAGEEVPARGPFDSGRGVRIQGGRVYDSLYGVTCHWCRQKTLEEHVTCTNPDCSGGRKLAVSFCKMCLMNRHGEDIAQAEASGCWVCPPCRGSCGEGCTLCCNCGPCRKKAGLGPTHQMIKEARGAGFSNVHDFLVHSKTREAAEEVAARKEAHPWGAWLKVPYEPATQKDEEESQQQDGGEQLSSLAAAAAAAGPSSAAGSAGARPTPGVAAAAEALLDLDDNQEQEGDAQGSSSPSQAPGARPQRAGRRSNKVSAYFSAAKENEGAAVAVEKAADDKLSRTLAYTTFGTPLSAPPRKAIIYLHGWPSSRLEAAVVNDEASRQGFTIVSVDRPGSGQSTFNPAGTFESLARDVEQLLDHLQLESASLWGTSGGSAYATACAALLPSSRIHSLLLLSPLAPMHGREEQLLPGVNPSSVRLFSTVRTRSWSAWLQLAAMRQLMLHVPWGTKVLRSGFAPVDREALQLDQEFAAQMREASREGVRHGVAGPLHDMHLYCASPWTIDLESIRCPTVIWNGDEDTTTPNAMAQLYHERIPGSKLHLVPGEGHLSLVLKHRAAIVRSIHPSAL
ncbi:hypothetical protein N2152v2_000778 [Parachlorella kessleri]